MASWLFFSVGAFSQSSLSTEYQVKAACLLNFIRYIQWPESAFSGSESNVVIGVLGDDSFADVLSQIFNEEMIQGRKVVVKRLHLFQEIRGCCLVFVSKSEQEHLEEILRNTRDQPLVSIGESEGFIQWGGIINFRVEAGKIRFEINAVAAQRKGLRINSQLLKRAKIMNSESEKEGG
ncbi:MAG: YfiR family protein [Verrucomicrobiota bacterium]